jgi:hypothetical protein
MPKKYQVSLEWPLTSLGMGGITLIGQITTGAQWLLLLKKNEKIDQTHENLSFLLANINGLSQSSWFVTKHSVKARLLQRG